MRPRDEDGRSFDQSDGCGTVTHRYACMHSMSRAFLILLISAFRVCAADPGEKRPFTDGTYGGMESMPNLSPDKPKTRWFHQNILLIKGDTVILSKSPVYFENGRKFYSASTGGFFTYRGTIGLAAHRWRLELLLTEYEYAPVPVGPDGQPLPPKPQQFTITPTKGGALLVDKIAYRK